MFISYRTIAQDKDNLRISWSEASILPDISGSKQIGVAGPFVGLTNGVMLIAGGSNFPDAKPWDGGKKVNKDELYLLRKVHGSVFECVALGQHLAKGMAYGASVTTSEGIVCLGGETEKASCSTNAFIMRWDPKANKVIFEKLPLLPAPVANACAACIGRTVYLIGGERNGLPVNTGFKLDLKKPNSHWQSIPSLPIAMSHSVAVSQSDGHNTCIFVIGGRSATGTGISDLHNTMFCYDPGKAVWFKKSDIADGGRSTNLSAATGVALGTDRIIVISGDKGDIYHKIETLNAEMLTATGDIKRTLQDKKLQLVTHHPGFSKDVLIYNTVTNQWRKLGQLPFYGQVTTTAVKWNNDIFIPGGEIMPGTRTPLITKGTIVR
ncbi:MAG: hypothetical protein JST32_08950 [Bacteroidetes bacterium]|nr:hypothetical protein [Bacteroidota bacterium]